MIKIDVFRRKKAFPYFECTADEEADRIRRVRRANFRLYLAIWVGFFVYAFWGFLSAATVETAIDRFLPLQLVAGLAALVVFLGGRSLGRRTGMRKLRFVPVAFTSLGIGVAAMMVLATTPTGTTIPDPTHSTGMQPDPDTILVSL